MHNYGGAFLDTLYKNIKSLCEEHGVKPGKMCVDLGISKGVITKLKLEQQKSINSSTAQKIANYFGVSVDRVMGVEKEPHVPKDIRLSDEELDFIQWYRTAATEKDKALIKTIVESD